MTIKEIEEKTGLSRSNVRFYEKEKLIEPIRTPNGYRDYSQDDLAEIERIAFLRSIGIPVETIRLLQEDKLSLDKVLKDQEKLLNDEISQRVQEKEICCRMLQENEDSYCSLQIEKYVQPLKPYVSRHKDSFRFDIVSFLSLWGNKVVFYTLTLLCLGIALFSYGTLPDRIPIQWSGTQVADRTGKEFIFAYAAGCVACRLLVRPLIWRWLRMGPPYADVVTDYLTNFLCVVLLSVQVFTLFYLGGLLQHVTAILFFDAAVFLGMLAAGMLRVFRENIL